MTQVEKVKFFSEIKGPAAAVLFVLFLTNDEHKKSELVVLTGYTDKTVKKAIDRLKVLGYIQHNGHFRGWSLTPHFRRRLYAAIPEE